MNLTGMRQCAAARWTTGDVELFPGASRDAPALGRAFEPADGWSKSRLRPRLSAGACGPIVPKAIPRSSAAALRWTIAARLSSASPRSRSCRPAARPTCRCRCSSIRASANNRTGHFVSTVARLRPAVTIETARANLDRVMIALEREAPGAESNIPYRRWFRCATS